jgi:very-short-patch-repair endonuclease
LRGIPVTGPARTLLDLAAEWSGDVLLPVVERSVLEGLTTPEQIHDVLRRNPGRRGCRRLAQALDAAGSSALERRVASILRSAVLPPHRREHHVDRYRLDFAWPACRVAIEADGRRWHSSADGFERDRPKHNLLVDGGWRVVRVTWRDLDDPAVWLAMLERLL